MFGGRAARFTKLDERGRPVYGDGAQAVTKGIIDVTYTPNVTQGESTPTQNFAGENCMVPPTPCSTIDSWSVTINFCAVDPCIVLMMFPSWIPIYDDFGAIIGFEVIGRLSCAEGFALEVWGAVGTTSEATQCGPGATGGSEYLLMPRLIGSAPGDITVANEATTFSFTGTTTAPVGWRRGPYLVELVNGVPSVLRQPVNNAAQLRKMSTNILPPTPTNGCIELPRPVPEPATITIDRLQSDLSGMCARLVVDNNGFGPVTVNWGDGTDPVTTGDCSFITHCYDTPGIYNVCVADEQTPAISVCRQITVPMPPDQPSLDVSADLSDELCVQATVDMPPQSDGRVTLDWGDGTDPVEMTVEPGTPVTATHCYAQGGVYTIRAERVDQSTYYTTQVVIVPTLTPPEVSAAINGQIVTLTVDNHDNGLTTVDWGDGTTSSGPALDGGTVDHTYTADGTYEITVTAVSNPLSKTTITVTVGDAGLRASANADPTDDSGMTATVTWDNV